MSHKHTTRECLYYILHTREGASLPFLHIQSTLVIAVGMNTLQQNIFVCMYAWIYLDLLWGFKTTHSAACMSIAPFFASFCVYLSPATLRLCLTISVLMSLYYSLAIPLQCLLLSGERRLSSLQRPQSQTNKRYIVGRGKVTLLSILILSALPLLLLRKFQQPMETTGLLFTKAVLNTVEAWQSIWICSCTCGTCAPHQHIISKYMQYVCVCGTSVKM